MYWVDAVGIDQRNTEERNHQVTLMADIYRSARQVVIWQGEEADGSRLVFDHWREWQDAQNRQSASRVSLVNPPSCQGETWGAFRNLVRKPWFSRTDTLDWHDFATPIGFWKAKGLSHLIHGLNSYTLVHNLNNLTQSSPPSPRDVLQCSRFCFTTDPKDRVFGVLGLLDYLKVKVDYKLPLKDIFREFARAIIQKTQRLDVLHWVPVEAFILR
ncbi:hypothetical protein ACJ41O_001061 [Fusarium nematophilum]